MYTLSYADLEKITEKALKDYHNKFGDDYFKLTGCVSNPFKKIV